jgi:hypothetical protein
MGGAATPREAATPYRTVTHGQAGVRERQAKPHDRDNVRSSNDGRNETRALSLMSALRVNCGTPHSFRPTEQKPFQLTSFWTDP